MEILIVIGITGLIFFLSSVYYSYKKSQKKSNYSVDGSKRKKKKQIIFKLLWIIFLPLLVYGFYIYDIDDLLMNWIFPDELDRKILEIVSSNLSLIDIIEWLIDSKEEIRESIDQKLLETKELLENK